MYDFLKIPFSRFPGHFDTNKDTGFIFLQWPHLAISPPREADGMGGLMTVSPKRETESTYRNWNCSRFVFSNKISIFHDGYLYRFTSLNSFKLRKYKKRHGKLQCLWLKVTVIKIGETKTKLVGGFNPFEKYQSKWESSPIFGVKTKIYLKPPP